MLMLLLVTLSFALIMITLCFVCKHWKRRHQQNGMQRQDMLESICLKNNPEKLCQIAEKLDLKLKTEKIYTNPDLSIQDLALEIGTNRTYISSTINTFYNQNFCSYINKYRFLELADNITKDKNCSHKELASKCGFGSIDSMKRTVKINTGLSMKEWKDCLVSEESSVFSEN
jgi:YesN/AraC family two-component response regulator